MLKYILFTFLVFLTILATTILLLILDNGGTQIIPLEDKEKIGDFLSEIVVNIVPMCFCMMFGVVGAIAKLAVERDSNLDLITHMRNRKTDKEDDTNKSKIAQKIETELEKFTTYESNTVTIGALFGLIGYFVLSSHFILKLFYPDIQFTQSNPTFVGMAICGIGFGYFAKEFAGVSRKTIEKQIEKITSNQSDKSSTSPAIQK